MGAASIRLPVQRDPKNEELVRPGLEAEAVRLAFGWYVTEKYTDADIAWMLNERGYRTTGQYGHNLFSQNTMQKILQNRFYIGETSYQGKKDGAKRQWLPGTHEPLIDRELFNCCQEVRRSRYSTRNTSVSRNVAVYPLTTLLKCTECGSTLFGQIKRGVRYYRDPAHEHGIYCSQMPWLIKADVLEAQAAVLITGLTLPPDWRARALELAAQEVELPRRDDEERQRQTLAARIERAKQLYIMGDITQEEYRTQRDEWQAQMPPESPPSALLQMGQGRRRLR